MKTIYVQKKITPTRSPPKRHRLPGGNADRHSRRTDPNPQQCRSGPQDRHSWLSHLVRIARLKQIRSLPVRLGTRVGQALPNQHRFLSQPNTTASGCGKVRPASPLSISVDQRELVFRLGQRPAKRQMHDLNPSTRRTLLAPRPLFNRVISLRHQRTSPWSSVTTLSSRARTQRVQIMFDAWHQKLPAINS